MSIMKRVDVHDIAAIALLIAAANLAAAQTPLPGGSQSMTIAFGGHEDGRNKKGSLEKFAM
jgi:hypothetical protein